MKKQMCASVAAAVLGLGLTAPGLSAVALADDTISVPSDEVTQPDMAEPDMAETDTDPAGAETDTDPATPEVADPAQTDLTGADPLEPDATDLTEAEPEVQPCSSVPGPNPNSCAQLTFPECTAWSVDFARFGVGHCNDAAQAAGKGRPYTIEQCTASDTWEEVGTNDVQRRQRYTCTIPPQVTQANIQLTSMCRPSATEASLRMRGPVGAGWVVTRAGGTESFSGTIPESGEMLQTVPWASGDTWILTVTGKDGSSASTNKAVGDNRRCGSIDWSPIPVPTLGLVPAAPYTPEPAPAVAPRVGVVPEVNESVETEPSERVIELEPIAAVDEVAFVETVVAKPSKRQDKVEKVQQSTSAKVVPVAQVAPAAAVEVSDAASSSVTVLDEPQTRDEQRSSNAAGSDAVVAVESVDDEQAVTSGGLAGIIAAGVVVIAAFVAMARKRRSVE